MPTRSPTATEIGISPIHKQNMKFLVNENLNCIGYDSNGDVWPEKYAPGIEEGIYVDED